MTHYTIALAILIGGALPSPPAHADPAVDVDIDAPFTEDDLAAAIKLRHTDGVDRSVSVGRLSENRFVVTVGDRAQVVELTTDDRATSARVVALVVVALIPTTSTRHDDDSPLAAPTNSRATEAAGPSKLAFRASLSFARDDNGYETPVVNLGGAYAISRHANIVASAGFARNNDYLDTSSILLPVRLGIEGRAGAAGIEIGTQRLIYRESSCGMGEWGAAQSVHGVSRLFIPIRGSTQLTAELGGHLVVDENTTECRSASNFTAYGGWLGFGIEWQ